MIKLHWDLKFNNTQLGIYFSKSLRKYTIAVNNTILSSGYIEECAFTNLNYFVILLVVVTLNIEDCSVNFCLPDVKVYVKM